MAVGQRLTPCGRRGSAPVSCEPGQRAAPGRVRQGPSARPQSQYWMSIEHRGCALHRTGHRFVSLLGSDPNAVLGRVPGALGEINKQL